MFQIETVSAKMLDYFVDRSDVLIIDLRGKSSYVKGHVRGALNVPYMFLEEGIVFPKNKVLIFYCERGGASMAAARQYMFKGYKTRSVIGGFEAYRGRNLVISEQP